MSNTFPPPNSVGIVKPQMHRFETPLKLEGGKQLDQFDIIYETYGQLNNTCSNAILICHALSSDHHAAGYHSEHDPKPGWWDNMIGPGKPIDTAQFFVVSLNNLGGCKGSTGPVSLNPQTGKPYGPDFPIVTVRDWVNSQERLMQHLNIPHWAAIIGGSLGGMQALQWTIDYPTKLRHAVIIAATSRLTAQNIAFNKIAREAITSDPDFHNGHYYEHGVVPRRGLILARMLGHITYQSDEAMDSKFGRALQEDKIKYGFQTEFQVESYLSYQGEVFVDRFDANTYLLMTRALDYFDPAKEYDNNLSSALQNVSCRFLIVSFTSDWRFPPQRSREIIKALLDCDKDVTYAEIDAPHGHDAFLLKHHHYVAVLSRYLKRIALECQ